MTRIVEPSTIAPGVEYIGNAAILMYVVHGTRSALIDSGMTASGPLLVAELQRVLGGVAHLDMQLITHSHYDHVSGTPALKARRPDLHVAAHARVGEIVAKDSAVTLIRKLNATVLGGRVPDLPDVVEFVPFAIDEPVADGTRWDLGRGVTITALHTPGHTQDSITYYLPHAKAIVPAEAAGVPDHSGIILPEFLQSYSAYMASLDRLARLDVAWILLPHNYVLGGDAAKSYIGNSIAATIAFKDKLAAALDRYHGDQAAASAALMAELYSPGHGQPADAFRLNLDAMLATVAREFG